MAATMSALAHAMRRLYAFYGLQVQLLWKWRAGRAALMRRAVASFVIAFVAFGATVWIVPGIEVNGPAVVVVAIVVLAVLNALIRPVLFALVEPISLLAVSLVTFAFQVGSFLVLGSLIPGLELRGLWVAFVGSWVFAIVHTLLSFSLQLDPDESYYGLIVRALVRRWPDTVVSKRPGIVIVQIDGLAHPVLAHQLRAGRVTVMSRWIRSGKMRLAPWEVLLPSQTSASQAGILHGNNDGIPAFRWFDRDRRTLLVSNHPRDALEIQRRVSNGRGLLSDGGASIGNLLTGDAARSYITMASLNDPKQGIGQSRAFATFFISPHNYLNAIVLAAFETMKELVQAHRQAQRGVEPRMHRGLTYALVRASTNVVLRQLNTSLVIEEMCRGTPLIYVDFTDYDEIAHHSGPERPESLDSLDGIDRVLGLLERAATDAPRPYRFVVLSDHGQTLGATFRQRYGKTLEEVVRDAMGGAESVVSATEHLEHGTQLRALLGEASQLRGATGAMSRAALRDGRDETREGRAEASGHRELDSGAAPELVVCASGNLALLYFPRLGGRQTLEALEEAYPGMVESVARQPGIGCLMVRSRQHGTLALGLDGIRYLDHDRVEGVDPVAQYGELAVKSLRRLDEMSECGDLVAISVYDESTGEVAAFEELIGSHGGLGGDQTHAFVLFPADWSLEKDLIGAPELNGQLRRWFSELGTASAGTDSTTTPANSSGVNT